MGVDPQVMGRGPHGGAGVDAPPAVIIVPARIAQVNGRGFHDVLHLVLGQSGIDRPNQRRQSRYMRSGHLGAAPKAVNAIPIGTGDVHTRRGEVHLRAIVGKPGPLIVLIRGCDGDNYGKFARVSHPGIPITRSGDEKATFIVGIIHRVL